MFPYLVLILLPLHLQLKLHEICFTDDFDSLILAIISNTLSLHLLFYSEQMVLRFI